MSVQLQRLADTDPRFEDYSNESSPVPPGTRAEDHAEYHDGHWLYTAPGWWNPQMEVHCIHEWTVRDVLAELREIEPCGCADRCLNYWISIAG